MRVAIRIEPNTNGSGSNFGLRIEGDLVGDAVAVLHEQLQGPDSTAGMTLDLSGVRFADRRGARLLHEAARSGYQLSGASPYIELLIERQAGADLLDALPRLKRVDPDR